MNACPRYPHQQHGVGNEPGNGKREGALTAVQTGNREEAIMISSAYLASALVIGIALGTVLPLI